MLIGFLTVVLAVRRRGLDFVLDFGPLLADVVLLTALMTAAVRTLAAPLTAAFLVVLVVAMHEF